MLRNIARAALVALAIFASAFTAACGNSTGPTPVVPPPPPTVVSVDVVGPVSILPFTPVQYRAIARWSDGTQEDVTTTATWWEDGNPAVTLVSGLLMISEARKVEIFLRLHASYKFKQNGLLIKVTPMP